ncbi:hypothetical protein RclHR1_24450003 [Rhizophagus clarus]|uniref:Reverse transcriptase domain-containing protein n=1 Tax=Rhizophagus clarus TaxID=94130 RepID=A0A2Z6QXE2_9GLOM|nr:hypothetical protein RclHR1_24450003 [Rhizophagus clarus]
MLRINGKEVRIIIDSGAAVSVISNNLRKKLGIDDIRPSRSSFTIANGTKVASIEKIKIMLEINDNIKIPVVIEVMDKDREELILGNDILGKKDSVIDFENKEVRIIEQEEVVSIPIEYTRKKRYKETKKKGEFIKKEIEQLLKMGKIRKSWSPWVSPVTLAGKKSGSYRFCINYRKLNAITKNNAYPLPRIDELLEKYEGARWFTSLDLAVGYHQIEIAEEDKEKTAFICSQELFEYNVIPFGLKTTPAIFQRLMDVILNDYIGKFVTIYLDDTV